MAHLIREREEVKAQFKEITPTRIDIQLEICRAA
jgi:hypothetical protein